MELSQPAKRKQWRALVKKLRRKKIRQKAARERDKILQDEEEARKCDPAYQECLQQQNLLEEYQREAEERQQQYLEAQWLRREHIAQQQFAVERQRQQADEATREAERLRMEKQLEESQELQRKKLEEKRRLAQQAADEFESMIKRMEEFLADPEMEVPAELRRFAETHPGRDPCQVFERTNCCRYGLPCVHNHRRPMLSRVLFISHFFSHPLLEQVDQKEYGSDVLLEYSDDDISRAYAEFFEDVVPELEGFGTIVNIRTVSNTLPYMRGHMFVEYTSERAALNAFIKLQGRYYAKKRLNVEFSNIIVWRTAVCGTWTRSCLAHADSLHFIRKCPQGRNCLYLHLFRNPGNRYNTQLEVTKSTPSMRLATPLISWKDLGKTPNATQSEAEHPRNWRWSESPEIELKSSDKSKDSHVKNSQNSRNKSEDKERSRSNKNKEDKSKRHQSSRNNRSPKNETSHDRDNKKRSTNKDDKSIKHADQRGSRSRSPNRYHSNNYAKDKTNRRRSRNRKSSPT